MSEEKGKRLSKAKKLTEIRSKCEVTSLMLGLLLSVSLLALLCIYITAMSLRDGFGWDKYPDTVVISQTSIIVASIGITGFLLAWLNGFNAARNIEAMMILVEPLEDST